MINTLRRGDTGEEVSLLQKMLYDLKYDINVDGDFGRETESCVKLFQKANGLKDDGVVGYNTITKLNYIWNNEFHHNNDDTFKYYDENLANCIVEASYKFVGQEEIPGNMGFKTPWFYKLMTGVGFVKTHPWCSYFTELVWKTGYQDYIYKYMGNDVKKQKLTHDILSDLFSASVMTTYNNFRTNDEYGFAISNTPLKGCLFTLQSKVHKSFGHTGIVSVPNLHNSRMDTVEGNTNDKGGREGYIVAKRMRSILTSPTSSMQLVGFIIPSIKFLK